jgi:MerR family mercuric resistance operon transcriptional regulator
MKKGVRIGELAAACGVTPDTVRFYERKGLLPQPRRTGAGHRVYDYEAAVERLKFIRRAHEIGLSLADVQTLARTRANGQSLCRVLGERLRARLQVVDDKLQELSHTRTALEKSIELCENGGNHSCPMVEYLERGTEPGH